MCRGDVMKTPPHLRLVDADRLKVQIQFEPRDMWIGLFWRVTRDVPAPASIVHLYVCLIPCFPLHLTWLRDGDATAARKAGVP